MINPTDYIVAIVKQFLPQSTTLPGVKSAIVFSFTFRTRYLTERTDANAVRLVHCMIWGHSVWWAIGESDPFSIPLDKWKNKSNHHEGWWTSGLNTIADVEVEVLDSLAEEIGFQPCSLNTNVKMTIQLGTHFADAFQFADAEVTFDSDKRPYPYTLVELSKVKMELKPCE